MPSHQFAFATAFAAMVALVLPAGRPAMAVPIYQVRAQTAGGNVWTEYSNVPQSASSSHAFSEPDSPQNMTRGDAFAVARAGQLGANVHAVMNYPTANQSLGYFGGIGTGANALATFFLDDLIIVSESDPSHVGSVQGSFSFELSGFISRNAVAIGGSGFAIADSRMYFGAGLGVPTEQPGVFVPDAGDAYFIGGGFQTFADSLAPAATNSEYYGGLGVLENGFDGNELFTSGVHTLPVGMPFSAYASIEVTVFANGRAEGPPAASEFRYAEAAAGFGNTLGFPINMDVFSLPPGYTVHSVSGGIVNNRFFPVPEPSTIALLACGICTLLLHRRGNTV